jgi:hypothetical protein
VQVFIPEIWPILTDLWLILAADSQIITWQSLICDAGADFWLFSYGYLTSYILVLPAMYKKIFLVFSSICLFLCAHAQDWKLRTDKNGIKVYSKQMSNSRFNALKVESEFPASLSQLVAVILDINTSTEWLYSTKSCVLLKTVSPSELYYYSEVSFPWPSSNRDFVAHIKVAQDPRTKVVNVHAENVAALVPEKKGIVRVKQSVGNWTITPVGKNNIHVSYELQVDPGGAIPAWLVNMLATKGPYESFIGLRKQLEKPAYSNARFPFIID